MTCNEVIRVRPTWNDWRIVELPAEDLQDFQWLQPAGAPRMLMHASVCCSEIVRGLLPHQCCADGGAHRLAVCILRCDVGEQMYAELAGRAAAISDRRRTQQEVYDTLAPLRRAGNGDRRHRPPTPHTEADSA
jgi:hypothetical protein